MTEGEGSRLEGRLELLAQIGLDDIWVALHLGRGAVGDLARAMSSVSSRFIPATGSSSSSSSGSMASALPNSTRFSRLASSLLARGLQRLLDGFTDLTTTQRCLPILRSLVKPAFS